MHEHRNECILCAPLTKEASERKGPSALTEVCPWKEEPFQMLPAVIQVEPHQVTRGRNTVVWADECLCLGTSLYIWSGVTMSVLGVRSASICLGMSAVRLGYTIIVSFTA